LIGPALLLFNACAQFIQELPH